MILIDFRETFKIYNSRVVLGADSEDFVILACVVLIGQQGVTNGRTDRRTSWDS